MLHSSSGILLILLALGSFASGAAISPTKVDYKLSATLADGGILTGSFTLDLNAAPSTTTPFFTEYTISDFSISLAQTTLFSGTNRGSVTDLELLQRSSSGRQDLVLLVLADNRSSNAFGQIEFSPFTGQDDVPAPIEGTFSGGYLDGAGFSVFESATLVVVPEPSALMLSLLSTGLLLRRDRRHD